MESKQENQTTLKKPSLVINAISNYVALGISIIIGIFLTPYIIKSLGTGNYGIWTLISAIVGYYGLLDLGVTSAIMRYVARYIGKKDYDRLNKTVNTSLAIFCTIGFIVAIVSIFIADPLAQFFNIQPSGYIKFKQLIWIMGITSGLVFPGSVFTTIIFAHERYIEANIIRTLGIVIKGGLTFVILYSSGGLVGIGWANLFARFFLIIACFLVIKSRFKHVIFSFRFVKIAWVNKLISFGAFTIMVRVGYQLRFTFSKVIIGKFSTLEYVGVYGVPALLIEYIRQLVRACVSVTHPRLSNIAAKDDLKILAYSYMRYSIIISVFATCIGLVGIMLGREFIELWVPANFKDVQGATIVFFILVLGLLPDFMTSTAFNALQAIKKHHYPAYQSIGEGVINVILSIILIRYMGIYGVALGTAIPSIIARMVIQPIYSCRILRINWWKYFLNVLLKPIFVASFIYLAFHLSGILFTSDSYSMLISKAVIIIMVYSIPAFIICLDKQTRSILIDKGKNSIKKIARSKD